jgi:hypothetical protein
MAGRLFSDEEVSGFEASSPEEYRAASIPEPTEEEYAPPTGGPRVFSEGDLGNIGEGPGMSKARSFFQGGTQGASFGFSDEAAGVGSMVQEMMPEFLGGMPTEEDDKRAFWQRWADAYKTGRDDERKINREAQEANPWTYMGGNIAGGMVATAPLMATGGAGTTLAKAVPKLSKAAVPIAGKLVKPAKYLHQLANKSNTVWGATKLGAGMGGATGLGMTEEITDPWQAVEDTAGGILTGAAAAGTLTAGMKGLAAIPKWASARSKEVKRVAEEMAEHTSKAATHADDVADDMLSASQRVRGKVAKKIEQLDDIADELPDAKAPKGWRPEPGTKAQKAAKFKDGAKEYQKLPRGQAARDAEYFMQNRQRILDPEAPSLDTQNPNNLYARLTNRIQQYADELDGYEEVTNDLLLKSGARARRKDVIDIFQEEIAKARSETGTYGTSAVERRLAKYIEGWPEQEIGGLANEGQYIPADRLRNFLRGLRKDRKGLYDPKKEISTEEQVLKNIANKIRQRIEKTIMNKDKGLGEEYAEAMREYAGRMNAWSELKKRWKLMPTFDDVTGRPAWRPEAPNWFDTYFVHPIQKVETGERFANDSMMRAIKKFGDVTGDDWFTIVKDQQVFGRLFPAEAMGLQRGTWTAVTGRAASGVARGAMGHMKAGAKEFAGAASEASAGVKENLFKKLLMEEGVPMSAELLETGAKVAQYGSEFAKGVGKFAEGSAKVAETIAAPFGIVGEGLSAAAAPVGRGYAVGRVLSKSEANQAIESARKRGGNAEAATAYVLQQMSPEFREERTNQ